MMLVSNNMSYYVLISLTNNLYEVPIFDATAIFQGKEVDTHFDFANVGKVCPILNRELMEEDLVAIIHSVSRAEIKSEWSMQFGVYGVVLLATKI